MSSRESNEARMQRLISEGIAAAMAVNVNANVNANANNQVGCSHKTFMASLPQEFSGTEGPIGLTRWFEKIESIFRVSRVCEEDKDDHPLSSSGELEKLETKLKNLKMKGTDINAYDQRFFELKLLCPNAYPDEDCKIEAYIDELFEQIETGIESSEPQTIEAAISMAYKLNDKILRRGKKSACSKQGHIAKDCKVIMPDTAPPAASSGNNGGNGNGKSKKGGGTQKVCYECGKPGHFRDTCPNKKTTENASGRAFNINSRDAMEDPKLVTGTFLVNDLSVYVLFNLGTDLSFVSSKFSPKIKTPLTPLNRTYLVEVANGKVLTAKSVYGKCNINLAGRDFEVDLIPIDLGSFDVVIGIDWFPL
ncbi:uncharacterized protein [Rutidosis leptorrhynchoides]|uniref:uncharacterized protein n=1 Tax=Rutidosis leptorrhynchoides TaxID=125765 RepID=UPI003A9A4194